MTDTATVASAPIANQPDARTAAVVGVVTATRASLATRYAKDADKAPTMRDRSGLLHVAAAQVGVLDRVVALAQESGIGALDAAGAFAEDLAGVDERLRPADWGERLVKSYLVAGLLSDFCMALTDGLEEGLRDGLVAALGDDSFGELAANRLLSGIDGDAQLAARLGLWGRRVVGEEISDLQRLLSLHRELRSATVTGEALHEVLSQGASSRMRGLGLRV